MLVRNLCYGYEGPGDVWPSGNCDSGFVLRNRTCLAKGMVVFSLLIIGTTFRHSSLLKGVYSNSDDVGRFLFRIGWTHEQSQVCESFIEEIHRPPEVRSISNPSSTDASPNGRIRLSFVSSPISFQFKLDHPRIEED